MRFLAGSALLLLAALPICVVIAAPQTPINSARQLLGELGVGPEQLKKFVSGQPFSAEELELVGNVLHQLHHFPPHKAHTWARRGFGSAQLAEDPESYRGELLLMDGRIERVALEPLAEELAERFEIDKLYRCSVALDDGGRAVVFTKNVPRAWKLDEPLDQLVSFAGVFLKTGVGEMDAGAPELFFAAERMAWHPKTLLGRLGMDYGLLEGLEQRKPISASEAGAFYRFLQAASAANLEELLAATKGQQWTIIPKSPAADKLAAQLLAEKPTLKVLFLGDTQEQAGELTAFQGRVHRCVRVPIADPELAERLGIREYYELAIFVNLDYRLAFGAEKKGGGPGGKQDGSPERKEVDTYPVFACVPRLPPGFPTGEKLNEVARVPGFFFKLWAYPTTFAAADQAKRVEYSPLVMGPGIEWLSRPQIADPRWAILGSVVFVALVAIVAFFLWRTAKRDRDFRRKFVVRKVELPNTISSSAEY